MSRFKLGFAPIGKGVTFDKLIEALRAMAYDGLLSSEDFPIVKLPDCKLAFIKGRLPKPQGFA